MRQYVITGLVILNLGLMGWMLVDVLIKLGSTKQNIEAVLSPKKEVLANPDTIRKLSESPVLLSRCKSQKWIAHKTLGVICLIEGVI
jgi:hypothetical protein